MGIDKANIRHVIRNGVPESILSWAQELGRAGHQACATILYWKSDISHANSWILSDQGGAAEYWQVCRNLSDIMLMPICLEYVVKGS